METTTINESNGNILDVICIKCNTKKTKHKVLSSVKKLIEENDNTYSLSVYTVDNYQIIECMGCGNVTFRSDHIFSEHWSIEKGYDITEKLYPNRNEETIRIKDFCNTPDYIRLFYKETIDCFNNENLILCTAGTRALVEAICKDNNIANGNIEYTDKNGIKQSKLSDSLAGKINGLFQNGKLTKENAEYLNELKFLGNEAVHELKSPTKDGLKICIEIIEHTIESLYEIPSKGKELKQIRNNSK